MKPSFTIVKSLPTIGKKRRKHDEDDLHVAIASYLDMALPHNAYYFTIPNGGYRNKIEAYRLKRMGVKAGVSDIIILFSDDDGKHVLFAELKTTLGKLSPAQKLFFYAMERMGIPCAICRSIEDLTAFIEFNGLKLKARVM